MHREMYRAGPILSTTAYTGHGNALLAPGAVGYPPGAMASEAPRRVQLYLDLPYKKEPREDLRVRAWLDRGYRIAHLQRLTDRDAVVTLERPLPSAPE